MSLISSPYRLFLPAAAILLTASLFFLNKLVLMQVLNLDVAFGLDHLFWALATILFLSWLLYLVARRVLYSRRLTGIHVVLTLLSMALLLGAALWPQTIPPGGSIFDEEPPNPWLTGITNFSLILLAAVQVVFLLNLVMGLAREAQRK